MSLIRTLVRARFTCTSRRRATRDIRREAAASLAVVQGAPDRAGNPVRVPPMLGVDEDMRDWTLYQVLEHDRIVNGMLTAVLDHLANGAPPPPEVDPKRDVMPGPEIGPEVIPGFEASVDHHLETAARAVRLRGTERRPHPIFGPLDAHGWHCMFAFHLKVHRRQMEAAAGLLANA